MSAVAPSAGGRQARGRKTLWIAAIHAQRCIGCTKCIDACPFDAILGASRRMHTVIDALCIGCERCVAPCPVDCITMNPVQPARALSRDESRAARARREARQARLARAAATGTERRRPEIIDAALRRASERGVSRDGPAEGAS